MNCIFCKIINGEIPSYKLYEDDTLIVILDVNPDTNGHCLIIPKKHITDITDMDNNTFSHILDVARIIKKTLEEKLNIDGLSLIQNNGSVQEIKHFHLHLKPFYNENNKKIDVKDVYNILKG